MPAIARMARSYRLSFGVWAFVGAELLREIPAQPGPSSWRLHRPGGRIAEKLRSYGSKSS